MKDNKQKDRVRGSLIGGAIGDAFGYPVEFIYSYEDIQMRYGEKGITKLDTTQWWSGGVDEFVGVDKFRVGGLVTFDTQVGNIALQAGIESLVFDKCAHFQKENFAQVFVNIFYSD